MTTAPLFPPFQNIFRLLDPFAFFYIVFIISIGQVRRIFELQFFVIETIAYPEVKLHQT